MKKTIIVGMLGMVLVSLVSAGLLDYFGKIEGSVEVSGPVFYIWKNGTSEELKINNIFGGTHFYILGENERTFFTEEFDEPLNFYKPKIQLSVEAKISSNHTFPKRLNLEFGYLTDESGGGLYVISEGEVLINKEIKDVYSIIPINITKPEYSVKAFYYTIEGLNLGDVKIYIGADGETKAQVLGVAT